MPPIGRDDQVLAMHTLNVMECAKTLVAAIAAAGGVGKADLTNTNVRDALSALFDQTSKLQVYEARARARGTVSALDDARLALAVKGVRDARLITADEQEVLDATPEQIAHDFSFDGDDVSAAAPAAAEAADGDDFSL